jgi:hypothetical protein
MCVVVGAIPITAMMQDGDGVFASHQYARVIWAGLVVLAIAALLAQFGFWARWPPEVGSPLLLLLPLIQAIAFLGSQRLFKYRYGRGTVCFSSARNSRDASGKVRRNDLMYRVLFGYVGTALSFLVAFRSGLRPDNIRQSHEHAELFRRL